MVTILPQKTNVGSQIGQSLGAGLQQGLGQATQQQYQRGMLQQALGKVGEIAKGGGDPIQALTSLMEAGAGIPGSEKYIGALAPILLGQMRSQQLYGGQNYGAEQRGGAPPIAPGEASQQASQFVRGPEAGGFLAPPMNPEEMQAYAQRRSQIMGDPNAYQEGLQEAANLNKARQASRMEFEQAAIGQGVPPQELPRFMQMATEFQNEKDPAKIQELALKKYQRVQNLKDSLKNSVVPGIGTRLLEEGGKAKTREDYLKRTDNLVSNLIKDGEEPYVRQTLAGMGLSPTEVEERIHPLTPEKTKALEGLPRGDKMNPKARKEALTNFLRKNVDNDTSLSVIRQYLFDNMKYDWKEVADAVTQAFPGGDRLNQWQNAELSNIASPPKQSLQAIFGPALDIRGFLRGAK